MRPTPDFWSSKRVLLTGHTGFKGAWLALWLARLGAQVTGIALPAHTSPNLHALARIDELLDSRIVDLRDGDRVDQAVQAARPEIVLHLAAQALVRPSYDSPISTFATNVMGTVHLLDALRRCEGIRVAIVVTTDKVYRNREGVMPFREDDPLGGHDPYSASKAATEIVAAGYRDAFLSAHGVALATARAGNVIGGGDWSTDRLIPDAVRAWQSGQPLLVRRPRAVRPWQHVLEPLAGYLRLAEVLWQEPGRAGAYNFGPRTHEALAVGELVGLACRAFGRGEIVLGNGREGPHEAGWLSLEVAQARATLGVAARWSVGDAVARTMAWYARLAEGGDARTLCEADIRDFEAAR